MNTPELRFFRPGTSDKGIFQTVAQENEYRVRSFEDKVVVDVGAHIGSFGLLALANGCRRYIGFEPHFANYELLRQNIVDPRAALINCAVSSRTQLALFSMGGNVENTGGGGMFWGEDPVPVLAVCLDDILHQFDDVLLKLDCEGAEYTIISGSKLDNVSEIVGEWHNIEQLDIKPKYIPEWLSEKGFDVVRNESFHDGKYGLFRAVLNRGRE